jgi:predicted nucleic acid-binding protein
LLIRRFVTADVVCRQVLDEAERNIRKKLPKALNLFRDFTSEVAAQSGLVIQTPAQFIRDLRDRVTAEL